MKTDSGSTLRIRAIEPSFYIAASLDLFVNEESDDKPIRNSRNDIRLNRALANSDWFNKMDKLNELSSFRNKFTILRKKELTSTTDIDPIKRALNEKTLQKYRVLSTKFEISRIDYEGLRANQVIIKIFEHGAITCECSFKKVGNDTEIRTIPESIDMMAELREKAYDEMNTAINEFITELDNLNQEYNANNMLFGAIRFSAFAGKRALYEMEKYEYIDAYFCSNLSDDESGRLYTSGESSNYNIEKLIDDEDRIQELREIVGFCRMSKERAWRNFSRNYCRDFLAQEFGNRSDELWYSTSQRFIRYFPDDDYDEGEAFIEDIQLAIELLLSSKAVYKSLLEDVGTRLEHIPSTLPQNPSMWKFWRLEIGSKDIETIQSQLSAISYRLARTHTPTSLRFYTRSPFAMKTFKQLEEGMEIPDLSNSLDSEIQKLHNMIDSFGTVIAHRRNIRIQTILLLLTLLTVLTAVLQLLGP